MAARVTLLKHEIKSVAGLVRAERDETHKLCARSAGNELTPAWATRYAVLSAAFRACSVQDRDRSQSGYASEYNGVNQPLS